MKKLMFAVAAAALAQVGLAANPWINKACDIATTDQVDPSKNQYFLSQGGECVFTLSKDFTLTHGQFYAQSTLLGNAYWYARCVYDFRDGNHVLTVNPGFFVKGICAAGTTDEAHLDDLHAEHVFLGGIWDFNGGNFQCGYGGATWGDQNDHMEVTVDGTTFRNLANVYMIQKGRDSKVTFRNGAVLDVKKADGTLGNLYGFYPSTAIDVNNEIRYESGTKVSCNTFQDCLNWAFGAGDETPSQNWNNKTVITGEGTEIKVGAYAYFSMYLGGITTVIDDKAVVSCGSNIGFGNSLAAHNGTLIIDNGAKLSGSGFIMGNTTRLMENMELKIGDGAELHVTGQFMSAGKGNSLEIDNGTLKADGQYAFYFGHYDSNGSSSNYSLTFKGENPRIITGGDTQIRQSHVTFELVPGHTYTEPFITGRRQAFISDNSTIEFKNAKEYCEQLTSPTEIALILDAEAKNASFNATVVGLPDGARVYRNTDGNCVYLHLEPFSMKVGDQLFASFSSAAAAAEAGGTIELIRDAEISEAGVFGTKDNLTLDLAGHTLNSTAQYIQFNKNAATTLTLADSTGTGGTFLLTGGNWMTGWQGGTAGSTVIIEDGVTVDLGSNSIFEGHVYDNQLIHVKPGATITSTGGSCIYVGYSGSYNTLLVEGKVEINRLLLGHPKEGTGAPTYGAKIIIRGQDAVVNERAAQIFPMTGAFGCIDGEIVYDNCTIAADKDFWWHSTNPLLTGNQLKLVNGAKVKFANLWMGRQGSAQEPCVPAIGQSIYIGEDCTLEVGTQFMMTGYGNTLTIDNGTFLAGSQYAFYWGHKSAQTTCEIKDNAVNIIGPKAKLRSTDSDNAQFVFNGSTITFDLSKGIYEEAPVKGKSLEIYDDNEVVFAGLDAVYAYLNEQGLESVEIPLMQSSTSPMCYFFSTAKRQALNESLPAGVEVVMNDDNSAAFLRVQLPGFSYENPFTSFEAYNAAVTGANYDALYKGKDVYVVIRNFAFEKGVDYSPEKTNVNREGATEPKLHAFFYNCTFPGGDEGKGGMMGGDDSKGNPMGTNRKQINLLGVKEAWVEGCTFEAFNGDSYVIDFNLSTKCDTEGCGITITNNTFKAGAGTRVPISVKNKADKDPAFVKIVDNYFAKCIATPKSLDNPDLSKIATGAGVLCFADQSGKGANFPITVENNRFEDGVDNYIIMTGFYDSSKKEGIYVPVSKPFRWYYNERRGEWTAKPAFHQRVGTMIEVK